MTRGPGNNPIVSPRDVVLVDGVMKVTIASSEQVRADEFPANLLTLDERPGYLAELHRMMGQSDDGTVLTYRTRLSATTMSSRIPKVGEDGILRGWWANDARMVIDPDSNPSPRRSTDDDCYCTFCYRRPEGWVWQRDGDTICEECHERYVVNDQLGLRDML